MLNTCMCSGADGVGPLSLASCPC